MFCLSMWTLNQAPDEIFTEPTCACFPTQGHQKKVAKVAKDFCVFRLLLPCIEHTICMHQNANGWHRFSDVLRTSFVSCEIRDAKFSSETLLCGSLPVDPKIDSKTSMESKANCWRPGRFKETDLANVGTRSNEHMMNISENVSNQEPVINDKQIYARPNDTLSIPQDNMFPVSLLFP